MRHPSCQNEVVQMCTKNAAILLDFQTFNLPIPPPRRLPLTPSVTTKGTATARGPTTATPAAWDSMKTKSKVPVTVGEKKMSLECVRSRNRRHQGDEGLSKIEGTRFLVRIGIQFMKNHDFDCIVKQWRLKC